MNDPKYIIVHHSLTKDGNVVDWDAIRRYHVQECGWNDIGYHVGLELAHGILTVQYGRPLTVAGAHTKELGMNNKSIGICVVGNFDIAPPAPDLIRALVQTCRTYMAYYAIPPQNILGHREVGEMAGFKWELGQYKSCPGDLFPMGAVRKWAR
jgi:N-acetylmuramoyl-L-alanine amidase